MDSVRIVSEGVGSGTKVYDTESGQELHGIQSVEISKIESGAIVIATIRFLAVNIETKAAPKFEVCDPLTGEFKGVKAIEFADGTRSEF